MAASRRPHRPIPNLRMRRRLFQAADTRRLSASAFAPAVGGGRCELFPFQLLYALLQDFKRAVFADHSFFLIWDL